MKKIGYATGTRAGCREAYVQTTEDILRHMESGPKEFFDIVFDL